MYALYMLYFCFRIDETSDTRHNKETAKWGVEWELGRGRVGAIRTVAIINPWHDSSRKIPICSLARSCASSIRFFGKMSTAQQIPRSFVLSINYSCFGTIPYFFFLATGSTEISIIRCINSQKKITRIMDQSSAQRIILNIVTHSR